MPCVCPSLHLIDMQLVCTRSVHNPPTASGVVSSITSPAVAIAVWGPAGIGIAVGHTQMRADGSTYQGSLGRQGL